MNLIEKIAQVDWTVVDELHHIPGGRKGSPQEELRTEYTAFRKLHRHLGADLPPRAALAQAIFNVRRDHPDFTPRYDAGYFYEGSGMSRTLVHDPLSKEIHAAAASGGSGRRNPLEAPASEKIEVPRSVEAETHAVRA